MRVGGAGAAVRSETAVRRRDGGGFFEIREQATLSPLRQAAVLRAAPALEALLALQGVPDEVERRRRTIKRGRGLLDILDALKVELLEGRPSQATFRRLGAALAEARDRIDDPGLTEVIAEIELRAEVEYAKFAVARRASP